MTDKQPTGQEPEYYLITKNEIQQIADSGGISLAIVVRTRPYSPAPEPKQMSDEDKHAYAEAYQLGKRDGRQSERENVLDELDELMEDVKAKCYCGLETPQFAMQRICNKIESLRAGKEG